MLIKYSVNENITKWNNELSECLVMRLHVFLEGINQAIAKLKAEVNLTGFVYFTCWLCL